MFDQLPSLTKLMRGLQQVPYLASKNMYKVVSHFLHMEKEQLEQFCRVLLDAKDQLHECPECFCWKEKEQQCIFCASSGRNQQLICVVETWQDIVSIEKTGSYNGVYHVLKGVIYPLEGIGPEDLTIDALIDRIGVRNAEEIILATNQTPEGEATAAFIARRVKHIPVKVSCLARGLPVGSSLGAMDRLTIFKALSERRPF